MLKPQPAPDSPELTQARNRLPRFDTFDEQKSRYLAYRLCGFSKADAARYTSVTQPQVKLWVEEDEEFASIESQDIGELRRAYAKEIIALEFTRNFKLSLDVDARVLSDALELGLAHLSKAELDYLRSARGVYTMAQIGGLEQTLGVEQAQAGFDELLVMARLRRASPQPQPPPADEARIVEAVREELKEVPSLEAEFRRLFFNEVPKEASDSRG